MFGVRRGLLQFKSVSELDSDPDPDCVDGEWVYASIVPR